MQQMPPRPPYTRPVAGARAQSADGARAAVPRSAIPAAVWEQIRQHDVERRQRLLRILTLGIMVPAILLIPSSLFPKFILGSLVALLIVLSGTVAAYLLNQLHYVAAGGYALVAGLSAALAWQIISKVLLQHGVDALDLRYYDLLVLPVLLSAVVAGRRAPLIIAGAVSLFSIVSILVLPRTPTLEAYWNAAYPYSLGSAYDVVALAVLFQWVAGVIAWLGADSIRRALLHAARADELSAANERIQAQAREMAAHRYSLQEGMAQIQAVHAAIARGHWDARVRIEQGELMPMAMSLNLLLDRLTRLTREQAQRGQIEAAAHDLAVAMHQARSGLSYALPNYTGTILDEVLMEFAAMRPLLPGRAEGAPGPGVGASRPPMLPSAPSVPPADLPPANGRPWDAGRWSTSS